MRIKLDWKWEDLDETTQRAKVMGGWVLKSTLVIAGNNGSGKPVSESIVFISDKDFGWMINKKPVEQPIVTEE